MSDTNSSLTLEMIKDSIRKLDAINPMPRNPMGTIFGMNVFEHPLIPDKELTLELSHKVKVSAKFRNDFNKWSEEMFGIKKDHITFMFGNNIFLNPKLGVVLHNCGA